VDDDGTFSGEAEGLEQAHGGLLHGNRYQSTTNDGCAVLPTVES
jgi:hypothetical protein